MTTHDGSWGLDDATLSALIDGELAPGESRRALERVARDARLQARWARYHAVRAACEGATRDRLRPGFSERVRSALADEPTVLAPHARWRRSWSRAAAGAAVAASVAVATVGGVVALQWPDGMPGLGSGVAERGGEAPSLAAGGGMDEVPADGLQPVALTAAADGATVEGAALAGRHRMAVYLARHNEYAGAGEMPDLVPYSRLTSFNAAR